VSTVVRTAKVPQRPLKFLLVGWEFVLLYLMSTLHIRPYDDTIDFIHIFRMNCNPEAMRYIRPVETEEAPVRARVNHMLAHKADSPNMGMMMIENAETGEIVGNMVIRHANWDVTREVEIGYVIDPVHWGKGYATQSVELLLAYARRCAINHLVAFTAEANGASNRVLEKCGFRLMGKEMIYEVECLKWELHLA
jgi:RimJ/RimL family protein N-acetyltransferase